MIHGITTSRRPHIPNISIVPYALRLRRANPSGVTAASPRWTSYRTRGAAMPEIAMNGRPAAEATILTLGELADGLHLE